MCQGFCICVSVFGCRLSLVRLCDSNFGITSVDDITIWISCAAFAYYYYYYYYYYGGGVWTGVVSGFVERTKFEAVN